jgi:hypothetical protein
MNPERFRTLIPEYDNVVRKPFKVYAGTALPGASIIHCIYKNANSRFKDLNAKKKTNGAVGTTEGADRLTVLSLDKRYPQLPLVNFDTITPVIARNLLKDHIEQALSECISLNTNRCCSPLELR